MNDPLLLFMDSRGKQGSLVMAGDINRLTKYQDCQQTWEQANVISQCHHKMNEQNALELVT